MFSTHLLRCVARKTRFPRIPIYRTMFYTTKTSKPLRILFCGSDDFSSASLRALHAEQQRDPKGIASIDVLCRPGKLSGRSMKVIKEVPLKAVARELALNIHERDTFTGWELPKVHGEPINLIIAVSFGLFVPPRILKSVEYGGLNVHPSLLPNFRGPAPLQHTIMQGTRFTGVTLQTLDYKSFDHGTILDQTPPRGLQLEPYKNMTYRGLLETITPVAAAMLAQGIRNRVFIPPLPKIQVPQAEKIVHAGKVTSQDREIDWRTWDATIIDRRYRALGRLWSNTWINTKTRVRIIFEDIQVVDRPPIFEQWYRQKHKAMWKKSGMDVSEGQEQGEDVSKVKFMVYSAKTGHKLPLLYITDGESIIIPARRQAIRISNITAEGLGMKAASRVMQAFDCENTWRVIPGRKVAFHSRSILELLESESIVSSRTGALDGSESPEFDQNVEHDEEASAEFDRDEDQEGANILPNLQ